MSINLAMPVNTGATYDSNKISLRRGNTEFGLKSADADLGIVMTADNAPSPYVTSASSEFPGGGYEAFRAIDGVAGNWNSDQTGPPQWWKIDLGASNLIKQITILGASNPIYNPRDFSIQVSGNGTDWTTVSIQTGQDALLVNVQTYAFTAVLARYVRIYITEDGGSDIIIAAVTIWSRTYAADSPTVDPIFLVDSGNASTVWDMSALDINENLASEAGSVKYQYSCSATTTPTYNGSWLTLAQLQAESDPTGRYMIIKTQFISDGTQDASCADSLAVITLPSSGGTGNNMRGGFVNG